MAFFNVKFSLCIFCAITLASTLVTATLPRAEIDGILYEHNKARAEVGNPPIKWNETLAKYAQAWADKRVGDCAMEHSMGPYAENLASGDGMTGADATKYWITEKEEYDYERNNAEEVGHYICLVWGKTTELGCGISKCKNGQNYVICNYDPSWQPEDRPW